MKYRIVPNPYHPTQCGVDKLISKWWLLNLQIWIPAYCNKATVVEADDLGWITSSWGPGTNSGVLAVFKNEVVAEEFIERHKRKELKREVDIAAAKARKIRVVE